MDFLQLAVEYFEKKCYSAHMKAAGIIAEYNPFHKGHQFHIEETRKKTKADYVIVVMSGDFVQRGTPAMIHKYDRTRMALEGGADLVLQLPVSISLSSAEGFADGGVAILDGLQTVSHISFGCEAKEECEQEALIRIAQLLVDEPEDYKESLSKELKKGKSFPAARETAVLTCTGENDIFRQILSAPNNILAIEYLKSLYRRNSDLQPCLISRQGAGYHDTDLKEQFASATAIRQQLLQRDASGWENSCTKTGVKLLGLAGEQKRLLTEDDFSELLYYALQISGQSRNSGSDLDHRIENQLEQYVSWSSFAGVLKTKNQTRTAIDRILCRRLLDISDFSGSYYARVLGFRKSAAPLMEALQQNSRIPIITRLASAKEQLDEAGWESLEEDIRAADLYRRVEWKKSGILRKSDYRQPLILV